MMLTDKIKRVIDPTNLKTNLGFDKQGYENHNFEYWYLNGMQTAFRVQFRMFFAA
jgi:hypothetical protein